MTTEKAAKATKKESRFFIAKTVIETKKKIEGRVKTYNEKFIKKSLENGREFISELKKDPIKTIDDLIDDSRETLNKAKSSRMNKFQKKMDATKNGIRRKFATINQKTQRVYKGIENDAKLITEDFLAMGKKNLDKLPMKKTIEKKISAGIDSIPEKLNLPSKGEIDNLVTGIDDVNKKVDTLNKLYANA